MRRWTGAVVMWVLLARGLAWAGVIHVPGDYPTVLAGVDAAVAGDSVLVGPGTWTDRDVRTILLGGVTQSVQSLAFLKPGVALVGTAGSATTVLDGGPEVGVPVVSVVHYIAGTETTRVEGFTVTSGGDGVVALEAGPLVLQNCRVVANAEASIAVREQSITLVDCEVSDNNPTGLVGGALDGIDADVVCIRTTFARNGWNAIDLVTGGAGGNTLVMRDCVVADHRNRGVLVWDASSVEIEGCLFERNFVSFAGGGGGLQLLRVTTGTIRFSTFAFDSAGGGGGIQLGFSSVRVENCTFYRCHGENSSGALSIADTDAGAFNNVVVGTTGQRGALRLVGAVPHPDTGCNLLWDNEGGNYYDAWVPAPTDVYADPQLCDALNGDYTLSESSPAAPANSPTCGQIGAFVVGCGSVSVEATSWGRLKGLYRSNAD